MPPRLPALALALLAVACRGGSASPSGAARDGSTEVSGTAAPGPTAAPGEPVADTIADAADAADAGDLPFAIASADDGTTAAGSAAYDPDADGVADTSLVAAGQGTADTRAAGPAAARSADTLYLAPAAFTDLPGWADDQHGGAVLALRRSCTRLTALPAHAWVGVDRRFGRARDWASLCAAVATVADTDHAAARRLFEAETRPWAASSASGPDGKITAYHVQPVRASRTRHGRYQTPIYARPPDLVMVDLARFIPDARGRKIWGRIDPATGQLTPYPTRAEIRRGALAGQGLELLWLDDPIDALFLEIQGSGKAAMDDGSTVWIQFDGKNGRPYRGIAGLLRARGRLPKGQGTLQGIRKELERDLPGLDALVDGNHSKIFFTIGEQPGAVGSQGVVLTSQRSAAVDRAFIAASTPLWIDTRAPRPGARGTHPWRRLVIAQDTGGNIRGPVRADLFWGDDPVAVELAGRTGGPGRYWLLLPRTLSPPAAPPR